MKVGTLKKKLYKMCCDGFADYCLRFDPRDDGEYSINHIYVDDDGDVCLESTDMENDTYDFTVANILHRLKNYSPDDYVYFMEEYEDGDTYAWDITGNYYEGYDDDGDETIFIYCCEMDD